MVAANVIRKMEYNGPTKSFHVGFISKVSNYPEYPDTNILWD
jgi:hypothetical protein